MPGRAQGGGTDVASRTSAGASGHGVPSHRRGTSERRRPSDGPPRWGGPSGAESDVRDRTPLRGDRLILQDIEASCRLGVYEWEQTTPQPIWIDLELAIDAARAAASDEVGEAVDYAALVTAVRELAQRTPYRLLETMAEAIGSLILTRFKTSWVRVRVKKRALEGVGYAAVEIERRASRRRVWVATRLRPAVAGNRSRR